MSAVRPVLLWFLRRLHLANQIDENFVIVTASLLAGIGCLLFGYLAALILGFPVLYLSSAPTYLGVIGIGWVLGWLAWGIPQVKSMPTEISGAFLNEDRVAEIANEWLP